MIGTCAGKIDGATMCGVVVIKRMVFTMEEVITLREVVDYCDLYRVSNCNYCDIEERTLREKQMATM